MTITRKSLADTVDAIDDQIADLQASKRDAYQSYREQLTDLMGKDEVKVEIEATKVAIKRRRSIREKGEEVIEHKDALADEIFNEISASRAPRATRVEIIEEFDADTGEILEDEIPHSQHAPSAANDLTGDVSSSLGAGQAPHNQASEEVGHDADQNLDEDRANDRRVQDDTLALGSDVEFVAHVLPEQTTKPSPGVAADKTEGAPAPSAPRYAAPGVVTWESSPPEGVERSPYSMAFGIMGQDTAVIADDLEKGRAQPIVKMGRVIIDGWARYMAARDMRELDGSPVAYPVVQYDGQDPLIDVIKLNVDGRLLNEQQKRLIAATLSGIEPKRKADIFKAFELFVEPV
jgi:hypothetical protein